MDFLVVHKGVDSLYMSFWGRLRDGLYSELVKKKLFAQSEKVQEQIQAVMSIGEHHFVVKDKGTKFYSFILADNWFHIQISESDRKILPTIYVQIKSELLNCHGFDNTVTEIRNIVTSLMDKIDKESISRVDIFIDFLTDVSFEAIDRSSWVRRAENFHFYCDGDIFTGITIGQGGDISARLYDKTVEIIKSRKDFFKTIWQKQGWQEGQQVWRLEFQLKRNFLKQMSVVTIDDLKVIINDIWQHCTHEWLRLSVDDGTKNKSRWETHPLWLKIGQVRFEAGTFACVVRKVSKSRYPDEQRLFSNGTGYLVSYAAMKGYENLPDAAVNFVQDALGYFDERNIGSRKYLDGNDYVKKKISLKKREFNKPIE